MNRIKLVKPSMEFEKQILEYKNEFEYNNENMDGSANLTQYKNIEEWLDFLKDNSKEETVRTGLVPASTFLAVKNSDNNVVGMIDIRHRLNDYLFNFGGHIGYSVRRSERLKGYATVMLNLALDECKVLKINKPLVTCDKNNIGSSKTIISNSGILENEVPDNGNITQRYWITL